MINPWRGWTGGSAKADGGATPPPMFGPPWLARSVSGVCFKRLVAIHSSLAERRRRTVGACYA